MPPQPIIIILMKEAEERNGLKKHSQVTPWITKCIGSGSLPEVQDGWKGIVNHQCCASDFAVLWGVYFNPHLSGSSPFGDLIDVCCLPQVSSRGQYNVIEEKAGSRHLLFQLSSKDLNEEMAFPPWPCVDQAKEISKGYCTWRLSRTGSHHHS